MGYKGEYFFTPYCIVSSHCRKSSGQATPPHPRWRRRNSTEHAPRPVYWEQTSRRSEATKRDECLQNQSPPNLVDGNKRKGDSSSIS
ncbi:unnamed protein product [Urochloa humidicola]